MSEEHVKRKIDVLRQDPRYTQVLRLGRLPPVAPPPAAPQQEQQEPPEFPASAPSPEPSPSTSAGSPEENSRRAAGQKVLDATLRVSKKVHGDEPPLMPGLRGVNIGFNQRYGFQTMEGIIHLIDYGSSNGGFVPLPTQQRGACLFHAFRRSISCPREFTNSHLRHMLVSFICNRADELYPMLECSISGNYGHIRLSPEEYRRKEASGQLTDLERQEYNEPGPFSITGYCKALLKSDFYGEELCLRLPSMLFKVRITVLDGDSLVGIRIRHQNAALNADVILVHVSQCHYTAMGKLLS